MFFKKKFEKFDKDIDDLTTIIRGMKKDIDLGTLALDELFEKCKVLEERVKALEDTHHNKNMLTNHNK